MARRRRAMRLVEALIMGGAIRPSGSMVKPKHKGRPERAAFARQSGRRAEAEQPQKELPAVSASGRARACARPRSEALLFHAIADHPAARPEPVTANQIIRCDVI